MHDTVLHTVEMPSRRIVNVVDRCSLLACVLLVPGLWTLALLFMVSRTSTAHILFPTVSELLEEWPYITPLFFGAGLSSLFIAIVLVSTDWQLSLAYLSMVSAWGVVGTSNGANVSQLEYFHVVFTSLLFITSFALLYVCSRSVPSRISAFAALVTAIAASIAIPLLTPASDASNAAYEVLGVSELLYVAIYVGSMRQWVKSFLYSIEPPTTPNPTHPKPFFIIDDF
jgi:hypothetical protein